MSPVRHAPRRHSTDRRAPRLFPEASALLGEDQVEVSAVDQLRGLDSQRMHELTRFANSGFGRLIVHQHDFEFEKVPEPFDPVEVDARAANQEESAVFADTTDLSVGQRKRFT